MVMDGLSGRLFGRCENGCGIVVERRGSGCGMVVERLSTGARMIYTL